MPSKDELAAQIKAKGEDVRDKKGRKENVHQDIIDLKALKAAYKTETGIDWDKAAKAAASQPKSAAAPAAAPAAATEPEPANEGGGEEDGVRK